MAFKKKISANNVEVIKTGNNDFPVGMRFVYDGKIWHVTACITADNSELRRIVSDSGEDTVLSLTSLRKDAKNIKFVE
jgi:hypothetical protein